MSKCGTIIGVHEDGEDTTYVLCVREGIGMRRHYGRGIVMSVCRWLYTFISTVCILVGSCMVNGGMGGRWRMYWHHSHG